MFLSFLLSFSSFDCFNCSVVVLMDLRQWSSSCLSDFWLLFVNNLKKKIYILETNLWAFLLVQTLYLTLGVLYSFLPFLLENNVKWFTMWREKQIATMTKCRVCSAVMGFNQLWSRGSVVEMLFFTLFELFFFFFLVLICKTKCLFVWNCVVLCRELQILL